MSRRDLDLLLDDIFESCQKIRKYNNNYSFKEFLDDDKTIDAVVRNFITISEAVSNIDKDFKYENPQIE